MTDPLSVLSLAIAAGGGSVDGTDAMTLVAAGVALLQRSAPVVRALASRRAAILLPTGPHFLTALGACEGRGAVLVNPLASPHEIAHQIADAGVGAVFTSSALAPRLPAGVLHVLLDDAPRAARIVAPVGSATDVPLVSPFALDLAGDAETLGIDEEAAIVYTSAMAGTPLGAILTHRGLIANARATVQAAALSPSDHVLAVLPFAHLFGLVVTAVAPLLAGARVTTMPRFHPLQAAERLTQGDVTTMIGVPAVFATLLAALERRADASGRVDCGALRLCICGGAPMPDGLQDRWAAVTGVELRQGYGLTEAGPVCLFNPVDRPNARGTMGYPFPGVEISIREVDGRAAVPNGSVGEIAVRGMNVFAGYVRHGGRGLRTDADGWLRTGDLGAQRDDGAVVFHGLVKDMFTRNGFNIYPREIADAVRELHGVREVTVRAVPDPIRENDIALDIVGDVPEEAVKRWCAMRLSGYKQPSIVTVHA